MGLRHSSAIADACFYSLVDSWTLSAGVLRKFGLRKFVRFRDDIWVISDRPDESQRWFSLLCRRAAPAFSLEWVESSRIKVDMLAVLVVNRNGQLATVPKDRPLTAPLSLDSHHPWPVHLNWPRGVMQFYKRMCSHESDVRESLLRFLSRFELSHSPRPLLCKLYSEMETVLRPGPPKPPRFTERPALWLVLPYCRLLDGAVVQRALQGHVTAPAWSAAWAEIWQGKLPCKIGVAWKCPEPKFVQIALRGATSHGRLDGECGG